MDNYVITGYSPASLFAFFEQISAIPRRSGNEAGIASYLEAFAAKRGLFCLRDAKNNVFIRAGATPGREKEAAVLLQGHTDMVCEKNSDTVHDFDTEGLKLYIDDGWLRARGTTLGADDGIAVAVMLALLDGECKSHPTLECLFTTDEEVGLLGAAGFDYSVVTAKSMINMDSESEGAVIVGCAGGVRSDLTLKYKTAPMRGEALSVSLTGLAGGHSGENINHGRANAVKLLARIILALSEKMRVNIISVNGGSKDNAIPREAGCVLSVAGAERAAKIIRKEVARIRDELSDADKSMAVTCDMPDAPAIMFDSLSTRRVLGIMGTVQNGVIEMSRDIAGLVGFSRNLGVVSTCEETNEVKFVFSSRSPVEAQLDASIASLNALADVCGAKARHYSRYPGWDYARRSPLRDRYLKAARTVYGRAAEIKILHAGLECGIIKSKLPRLDIISIGPDMKNIHSPDEALNLASCERFWLLMCELLK